MTIKLGIIGLGIFFSKTHLPTLLNMGRKFEIKYVSTSSMEKFGKVKAQIPEVQHCPDIDTLLSQHEIDAVVACVPIPKHLEIVKKVVVSNKHLLIEKPIAHDVKSARAIMNLTKRNSVRVMVAEHYRYFSVVEKVKKIVAQKDLGELRLVQIQAIKKLGYSNPYYQTDWRINPKGYQGILLDAGIHIISIMRLLFGHLDLEYRHLRSFNPEIGKHDTVFLHVTLPNKVDAFISISYSIYNKDYFFLKLFFSNGCVKCNLSTLTIERDNSKKKYQYPFKEYREYRKIYHEFYYYLTKNREPRFNIDDAYKDLLLFDQLINKK